jgi:broad specificity phosphatase PhoE
MARRLHRPRRSVLLWVGCLPAARSFSAGGMIRIRPTVAQRQAQSSLSSSLLFRNHLEDVSSLRNDYFALRHGQSMANVAKIIASHPEMACTNYGLSEVGAAQAALAGQTVVEHYQQSQSQAPQPYSGILLLTSDLLRAKETAETVAHAIMIQEAASSIPYRVLVETRLRERGFGEWDGGSDVHYHDVWKDDATNPWHETKGVESVMSVMDRATKCITEWDATVENHMILCVAHGDVLQILQTAFFQLDGSQHRTLEHLDTATLRRLELGSSKEGIESNPS